MEAIDVRTAEISDSAAIQRVLFASYPSLMAKAYDQDLLRRAIPLITRPNARLLASGTYYVAETDGQVIGCGGWSHEEPGGSVRVPGIAHIRHFAVSADYIGRGVGRALFDRCEVDARAEGIRLFNCFASRNAVGFYAALGFRLCGEIEVQMPPDVRFPSLLMERCLVIKPGMLHAFCGKIASGKSSLAASIAKDPQTILISEDQLLSRLYPGEIVTIDDYVRAATRLREAIGPHLEELLRTGLDIVLDFQANTPKARAWIRSVLERAGADHRLHYLDVSDEVCKTRLAERNTTGAHEYKVSEADFELFNSYVVPPASAEGFHVVVHAKP